MAIENNKITTDIVSKLWNLCNILKDDGVTYHQYVTELTYLLFLKMAMETGSEGQLPEGYRWADLESRAAPDRLEFYKIPLIHLGTHSSSLVQEIFANASSFIKKPATLSSLVAEIDKLDWYSVHREDLLEKNANEKKSGAGQYFTPRALINSMVRVMQPTLADTIQDPAAGTGGFLIAANHYLRTHNDFDALTEAQQRKYRNSTFFGMEHVQDTHRLALMNLMLHGIDGGIRYGDTLSPEGQALPKASMILTNPPFGTKKGGGLPSRDDFTYPTSNKQFCFLQHIYRGLQPGGRAAVVLPDNVLFESNVGADIRRDLMDKCNLHTILRLPTGIFYAQGVKTNVLFFTRGETDKGNTNEVWVYDLRANMPQFGKRTQLTEQHFADFETAFGDDPLGASNRTDQRETGRFRRFSREQIAERGDSLDISWLKDDSATEAQDLPEPAKLAQEAMNELDAAMEELRGILEELGDRGGILMLPYDSRLKANSRALRCNMTDAEQKLWQRLRRKQVNGWQFYRQKPIGQYIVDFYCAAAHLVVEIDGSQHFEPEHQLADQQRDAYLAGLDLRVLRFDNRQVLLETDAVVEVISKIPPGPPFSKGGGFPAQTKPLPSSESGEMSKPTNPVPPFEKGGLGGIRANNPDNSEDQP